MIMMDQGTQQPAPAPISGAASPGMPPVDLAKARRRFRAYETNKKREQQEQRESRRYFHSRQWTDADLEIFKKRRQPVVTDNRIQSKINFVVGMEQRQRRDPKAYPRGDQDGNGAALATMALRFVCDQNHWESLASDVFLDGLMTGIGLAWVGVKHGKDGLDPQLKHCQADRFFYDPRSNKNDFSDARYMGVHLWMDVDELAEEHPDKAEAIEGMMDKDGGLSLISDADREEQWGDFERRRVRVVEMYEKRPLRSVVGGYGWFYLKFTGSTLLDSMWSPYLDEEGTPDCPYIAWSPNVDERGDRYGMVRLLRPMQDEINHRRSKLLHRVNVNRIHLQQGLVDDETDVREQLARPDGIVKHNGVWGKNIGIIDQSFEAKGEADLLLMAQSSLENLGPNVGLIGKGGGVADQSGRAIMAQKDSGSIELSPIFDRLRDWKLRCYRKMWGRVKSAWTNERWIRVTEHDDAPQAIGINQHQIDPMTGQIQSSNVIAEIDVDIILDEGPDTIVQREEMLQTFAQLGEAAAGPLGKVLIELSNVPDKDKLLAMIDKATAPDPMVMQLQQRMADLEASLKAAQVGKMHADTEKTRADTILTMAQTAMPPQAMQQVFPIQYADSMPAPMQPQQQPQMMPPGAPPMPDQEMPPEMMPQDMAPQMPMEQSPAF
jgi:hypothetical protein